MDLSKFGDDDFLTFTNSRTGTVLTQAVRGAVSMGSFRLYGKDIRLEAGIEKQN